jgi:hypothetical protein
MELTLRQRAFLNKLVDLCHEAHGPVHYSDVARTLGVSRFSAYDMLRLLERKGLVRAEYHRDEREGGPGRPSVVFVPLVRARDLLLRLVGSPLEQREWVATVEHILGRLEEAEEAHLPVPGGDAQPAPGDRGLLDELMSAIPRATSPLAYSAQVLTALLLPIRSRLNSLDRDLTAMLRLEEGDAEAGGGLDLLAGFALGAGLGDAPGRLGRDLTGRLMDYSRTCQSYIGQMDADRRRVLTGFVRELLDSLEGRPGRTAT